MSLQALLQELKGNGVQLTLNDASELSVKAPKGILTTELKQKLQTHKSNIIALLTQHEKSEQELEQIIPDADLTYEPFPMSDLQMGFYMADNDYMEFHVRPHYYSEIDYDNFDSNGYERAWNKMLSLHKGSIGILNNEGMIEPLKEIPHYCIPVHDFSSLSAAERQQKLLIIRTEMERRQLPIKQWPWFDLQISVWRDNDVIKGRVHYNNNNFFTDGCCTMRMMAKTKQFYNDPSLELIAFPLKTRDYVLAMQRLENSNIGKNAKHYWESRLDNFPPPPAIPLRPNMNRRVESHMRRRLIKMPPMLWQAFKNNAQYHGLTPSNAITAIYAQILSHWSNSQHFILGHMVTRRFPMHENVFDIIGCFPSVYPLEVDWRNSDTFLQCAKLLQQRISRDVENLSWGGMRVLQSLSSINGGLGRSPCPFVTSSGLFLEFIESPTYGCLETSQALIDHQFWDLPDGTFVVAWDLLEEFFPEGMIDTMWECYEILLNKLAHEKSFWNQPLFSLTPNSQLTLRQSLNVIESITPVGLIHQKLAVHAEKTPKKIALIAGDKTFTYNEIFSLSNKVAAKLQLNAARKNHLIAILADKGWEQIVGTLGILTSGAAYVPLSPTLPLARLTQIIQDANIKIVVAQDQHRNITNKLSVKTFSVAELVTEPQLVESFSVVQSPDDLAYVIYTSGSTGTPKGVMITHHAALNTILDVNERFNVTKDDIIFGISAFNFDLSVYDLFGAIEMGATLVLPSADDIYNTSAWAKCIAEHKVSIWNSTPAIMQLLVDYYLLTQENTLQLRLVMMSGDWIPLNLPIDIKRCAPNAKIISLGGATEASIWSIYYPIAQIEKNWQSIPYGYPLKNQHWHILNSYYQPCPDFVAGQLYISGAGLAEGYWNDNEKTQKAFINHPITKERLYATGDLGCYHPNGCIEFLGRADFQVKIQGFRIELGEIETVLMQHQLIVESVVVAKDNSHKGKRLVAYVVQAFPAADINPITISEIRIYLAEKLPDYMIPSAIIIVDKIPLTANGKVDRKSLMGIDDIQSNVQPEYIAPRNTVEENLVNIWQHVMEIDRIGVCDDFFELGGQSFSAIRIMTKISEKYSRSFSLGLIMEGRTIEYLANAINNSDVSHKSQPLVTIKQKGQSSPLFFIHPAGGNVLCYQGLAQSLENPFYGLQAIGMNPGEVALRNIETMAANYIEAIKTVQPHGPYVIGGWSSGGMIAHAMAKQLEQKGDIVEHILLIDTPAPTQYEDVDAVTLLSWFLEDLNIGFPHSQIPKDQLKHSTEQSVLDDLLKHINISCYLPEGLTLENLKIIFTVFSGIIVGCRHYAPTIINANILLIRATDGTVSEFIDHPSRLKIDWGWAELTSGNVKITNVQGTHYTLLQAPHLSRVVESINAIRTQDKNYKG